MSNGFDRCCPSGNIMIDYDLPRYMQALDEQGECERCEDEKEIDCPDCDGAGINDCLCCNGKGKIKCPDCNG